MFLPQRFIKNVWVITECSLQGIMFHDFIYLLVHYRSRYTWTKSFNSLLSTIGLRSFKTFINQRNQMKGKVRNRETTLAMQSQTEDEKNVRYSMDVLCSFHIIEKHVWQIKNKLLPTKIIMISHKAERMAGGGRQGLKYLIACWVPSL